MASHGFSYSVIAGVTCGKAGIIYCLFGSLFIYIVYILYTIYIYCLCNNNIVRVRVYIYVCMYNVYILFISLVPKEPRNLDQFRVS